MFNKILIANGQGEMKNRIFRIGHLSTSADMETIRLVTEIIDHILKHLYF